MKAQIKTSQILNDVKYEIRGQLAARGEELEKLGYEIISLNIGRSNPLFIRSVWRNKTTKFNTQ